MDNMTNNVPEPEGAGRASTALQPASNGATSRGNPIAPQMSEPQPRGVALKKLGELTTGQRVITRRRYAKELRAAAIDEERADYAYHAKVLATFREAKLEAFKEFYTSELIKFGIHIRAGLAEYATSVHQRLEEALLNAEQNYLTTIRKKIAMYDSFADLPEHTAILRQKLLPDLERFTAWTGNCIDHAKAAFQERVKSSI